MDRDSGDNGYVTYSLLSPTTDNGFRINSTTGAADDELFMLFLEKL